MDHFIWKYEKNLQRKKQFFKDTQHSLHVVHIVGLTIAGGRAGFPTGVENIGGGGGSEKFDGGGGLKTIHGGSMGGI